MGHPYNSGQRFRNKMPAMSRIFAYACVLTIEQAPENQIQEIKAAGFGVEPHRIVTETVSGSMAIAQRKGFSRLIDRMEKDDVLIVTNSTGSVATRSMSA